MTYSFLVIVFLFSFFGRDRVHAPVGFPLLLLVPISLLAFPTGDPTCTEANVFLGPALASIPFLWRFMQCIKTYHQRKVKPQLINAGKYTAALLVILFSTLHNSLCLCSFCFSLCSSFFFLVGVGVSSSPS